MSSFNESYLVKSKEKVIAGFDSLKEKLEKCQSALSDNYREIMESLDGLKESFAVIYDAVLGQSQKLGTKIPTLEFELENLRKKLEEYEAIGAPEFLRMLKEEDSALKEFLNFGKSWDIRLSSIRREQKAFLGRAEESINQLYDLEVKMHQNRSTELIRYRRLGSPEQIERELAELEEYRKTAPAKEKEGKTSEE